MPAGGAFAPSWKALSRSTATLWKGLADLGFLGVVDPEEIQQASAPLSGTVRRGRRTPGECWPRSRSPSSVFLAT